jgi:cytosine permease
MISLPVIFGGAWLLQRYSYWGSLLATSVAAAAALVFDWVNAALGEGLGRSASMISCSAFGTAAPRFLVSSVLVFMCLGWYGIQVEVTSCLRLLAFGANSAVGDNSILYLLTAAVLGLVFALPAVVGTRLFPWINYIAIPIILLISLSGVVLIVLRFGGTILILAVLLTIRTAALALIGSHLPDRRGRYPIPHAG